MLAVKLFGAAQASYFDRPLPGFPHQQANLLLCYLLLNRDQTHSREQLATVFWDDYDTHTSLKHLRNVIWKLKNVFQAVDASINAYFLISKEEITFKRSSRYWLDVDVFEAGLIPYQNLMGQELVPEQADYLEEITELYSGDLLEGVYEDWCVYDRERLSLLYLNTLSKLMSFHETHGTYERGLVCGRRLLAYDSTREQVHQQMMRLYWALGDRDAALAQYKHCARILRESLDVSPMEETKQLYQQMLHDQYYPSNWSGAQYRPAFAGNSDESVHALAEEALQKIEYLRATLNRTRAELHQLEQIVKDRLLNS